MMLIEKSETVIIGRTIRTWMSALKDACWDYSQWVHEYNEDGEIRIGHRTRGHEKFWLQFKTNSLPEAVAYIQALIAAYQASEGVYSDCLRKLEIARGDRPAD